MSLADLEVTKLLGVGTFGTVKLVKHTASGEVYAMKMLQKQQIVEMRQTKSVVNEKMCMAEARHPFILQVL
jgi:serine/threonine protein kinase